MRDVDLLRISIQGAHELIVVRSKLRIFSLISKRLELKVSLTTTSTNGLRAAQEESLSRDKIYNSEIPALA